MSDVTKYNLIGFDMDHTFVRYKLTKFMRLLYESNCVALVNHMNYPDSIFPEDEEYDKVLSMAIKGSYDHKNGNILKIGKHN